MFNTKQEQALAKEIERLKKELERSRLKQEAMLVEREFWVEQGRNLQNQLQTWQRMYASLYDQIGRGVVTTDSVKEDLAMAADELRQPITSVEAVRAMVAMTDPACQGRYTSVGTRHNDRITQEP